ncbi:hypothetical protein LHJ74_05640 [Streptomyces sp. N2-109]|uniref:Transposase n=1 Tax=Streptomyces gossypii TaxID=2883101 RepID=A0ABT2JNG3_9ACTN|nr:hypothetical protein [Streptomyces gossypii]MCT2589417.1 hypothetical protein [Streptomyces gossypii]
MLWAPGTPAAPSAATAAATPDPCTGDAAGHRAEFDRLIGIELGEAASGETHVATRLGTLGRQVCDLLLPPPLSACIRQAQKRAQKQKRGRQQRTASGLRLSFSLPGALVGLPVETLTPSAGCCAPTITTRRTYGYANCWPNGSTSTRCCSRSR